MKRLLIAGTNSGVGKTTITVAIIAALKRRGHTVIPFKVGPDYIDPGFHSAAAGQSASNLDSWMLRPAQVREILQRRVPSSAIAIIEGVMGLYDGRKNEGESGSSAQLAKITNTPVVLVASGAKMARSAAALVGGYLQFDPEVNFAGVIFNHVGSPSHYQILTKAVKDYLNLPVLGWLPKDTKIVIPERHLGLLPTAEAENLPDLFTNLADLAETHFDLDSLLAAAAAAGELPEVTETVFPAQHVPVRCRIAVAQDEAFHFYYQENLEYLQALGAELIPFSPLNDTQLPTDCHGAILGGGFPELYAKELSANITLREQLKTAAAAGLPIYAECGGYMYLAQSLTTFEEQTYPMCGIFPGHSRMHQGRRALGYVEVRGTANNALLLPQESCRGHEFRWSEMEQAGTNYLYQTEKQQLTGERSYNCYGSYLHLHFLANPRLAQRFITVCAQRRQQEANCSNRGKEAG
ncbi:MAG TPA: cobyrinate a,c-diamide synthase [Oscillospiraceae bacterium]|nr:cobyrinate a,c-diamide synthase [Oscillospiraceae bacterium]